MNGTPRKVPRSSAQAALDRTIPKTFVEVASIEPSADNSGTPRRHQRRELAGFFRSLRSDSKGKLTSLTLLCRYAPLHPIDTADAPVGRASIRARCRCGLGRTPTICISGSRCPNCGIDRKACISPPVLGCVLSSFPSPSCFSTSFAVRISGHVGPCGNRATLPSSSSLSRIPENAKKSPYAGVEPWCRSILLFLVENGGHIYGETVKTRHIQLHISSWAEGCSSWYHQRPVTARTGTPARSSGREVDGGR